MPNFTDYAIIVTTEVTVVATESGKKVDGANFVVHATQQATTSNTNNTPLRPAIAAAVAKAAEKVVPHANAVQANENTRRGWKGEGK